jgi:hypothetical protein
VAGGVQCHDDILDVFRDRAPAPGSWSGGRPRQPGGLPGRGRPGLHLIGYWVAPLGLFRVALYMAFSRSCEVPS